MGGRGGSGCQTKHGIPPTYLYVGTPAAPWWWKLASLDPQSYPANSSTRIKTFIKAKLNKSNRQTNKYRENIVNRTILTYLNYQ